MKKNVKLIKNRQEIEKKKKSSLKVKTSIKAGIMGNNGL